MPGRLSAQIDLRIEGVPEAVAENIRLHFSRWDSLPADELDEIQRQTRNALRNALQALGYYRAETAYAIDGETLILRIDAGEPVVWDKANIAIESNDGDNIPLELEELRRNHPFVAGERISHQVYDGYKRQLISQANQLGYLDAALREQQLMIDVSANRADVRLHTDLGERYQIDGASFSGSDINDDLLRRIAEVPTNAWFSAETVGDIYNRLLNSGYFASVNIEVDRPRSGITHLQIQLQDLPFFRATTGVGVDTDVGPFFSLRGLWPHLNTRGDSFNAELRLSGVEQEVTGRYRIPWDHPQNSYISWNTGWRHSETEDTETEVLTTGVSYHRLLDTGWEYSLHLDLDSETSQLEDMAEQSQTYVLPGIGLSRRRFVGDPVDPLRGYRFWINYVTSHTALGSDTNFQRSHGGINGIFTWRDDHSVLARFEAGAISADDFERVPISQRFFAGGDQSIRGYQYQSISPVDADENKIGGQYVNVASVEYRYQWAPRWRAAVFLDSGRAYIDSSEPVRTSAGIGLRWKSPVGFIALDVAAPIDEADEDVDPVRLHFYIATPL